MYEADRREAGISAFLLPASVDHTVLAAYHTQGDNADVIIFPVKLNFSEDVRQVHGKLLKPEFGNYVGKQGMRDCIIKL